MHTIQTIIRISLCAAVIGFMAPVMTFAGESQRLITSMHLASSITFPFGIAVNPHGRIIISHDGRAISRIGKNGAIYPVAGGTGQGFEGDGNPASQAVFFGPGRVAFDHDGNLFVPDMGNHRVRKIEYPSGEITTVVGHGSVGRGKGSFGGDGGAGIEAFLNRPISVAFDLAGAMYIADAGNFRIRKVSPGEDGFITGSPDEIIATVAGIGKRGFTGDKKLAVTARITAVDVAIDWAGHLFLADASNNRIRRVDKGTGMITTVVGSGSFGEVAGYSGHGSDAKHARMSSPEGIAFDHSGNLYIADTLNHRVRMVTPGEDKLITGQPGEIITTIVGSGTIGTSGGGFEGDGGPASEARLNRPQDVAVEPDGNLIIVDGLNHMLRRVIMNAQPMIPIDASPGHIIISPRQNDEF